MIKFFRHIRKSMINQNRTKKYLLYAIGEILLVVIGILIALQINIWNENRKDLEQGSILMKELLNEFEFHVKTFDWALDMQTESYESQKTIFGVKDLNSLSADSLFNFFGFSNIDVNITSNTYEKIKNQGIGTLSQNDSLNKAINNCLMGSVKLYNRRIDYYLEREKIYLNHIRESNIEFNFDLIKGIETIPEEEIKQDIINFIKLPKTKLLIQQNYKDKESAINFIIDYKKYWLELMKAIHKELKVKEPNLEPLPKFEDYLDYKIN
ncbi:DUF6090 family protein [Ichthyenterobacterium sp. W332]|uniref:DUF6090 family protein n=1 Tax=Microcosmobacter mediterraneus TaxID=3075607 RepID=A0ABU2YJF0_9FLAO|nr:DUF6090 family protein [Ichthyenterobacterium sp. W332]MDT0558291.1 DUF6090 family protein [Ichthyenterobacterium sp. W332]